MAVLHSNAIFTLTVCFLHVYKTRTEDVLGKTTDDFDFDGLPGAQHEFKIEVPPGIEECFIQKIASGANLHVSFEVCGKVEAWHMKRFQEKPCDRTIALLNRPQCSVCAVFSQFGRPFSLDKS